LTRNNDDDFLLIQAVFVTNEEVQCEKFPKDIHSGNSNGRKK